MTTPTTLPEWGQRLLDKMQEAPIDRRDRPAIGLKFPGQWIAPIKAAAKQRNLSIAAYARRALMAFVCHDLGITWDSVMKHEPKIHTFEHDSKNEAHAGQGFGSWEIERLR